MAVFLLTIWNLILPSFLMALISCKMVEILVIWQRFWHFWQYFYCACAQRSILSSWSKFWQHHSILQPMFPKMQGYLINWDNFLVFLTILNCVCANIVAIPLWNLILPSFSATSISWKRIQILVILYHCAQFFAIFSLHMCRNGYLWASSEKSDITIRSVIQDFVMGSDVSAIRSRLLLIFLWV